MIGAGRSEFVQAVFGRQRATSGQMRWLDQPYRPTREAHAIGRGIVLVPESRRDQGLCLNLGVSDNINLAIFDRLTRTLVIDPKAEDEHADKQIGNLRIATSSRDNLVGRLSGGNQQKVVIGKWLATEPRVIILDEPTKGIDVGSKAAVHAFMGELVAQGLAVIMVSSELPEILGMSDRVVVMREGRMAGVFERAGLTAETLVAAATGNVAVEAA